MAKRKSGPSSPRRVYRRAENKNYSDSREKRHKRSEMMYIGGGLLLLLGFAVAFANRLIGILILCAGAALLYNGKMRGGDL